jgi:hypothetical protein
LSRKIFSRRPQGSFPIESIRSFNYDRDKSRIPLYFPFEIKQGGKA